MPQSLDQCHREIVSGARRTLAAYLTRAFLSAIEPIYAVGTITRNRFFDSGRFQSHRAARPVVSIGNITTGGTGKTPVVRWLAEKLLAAGHHPAILTRGYKDGDEQRMLQSQLPQAVVHANPSRVDGAREVLAQHPETDLFLLDDGFQHRKLQRDFDLLLIDASNPFGFDHILPRGLLREPLDGLQRASAFLITRSDIGNLYACESILRKHNSTAPIYRSRHVHTQLRGPDGTTMPLSELRGRRVMTFCGIANPDSFISQIASTGASMVAREAYSDHQHYKPKDLTSIRDRAASTGAELIITTEKDWAKIEPMGGEGIWRAEMVIEFEAGDEAKLLERINRVIESAKPPDPSAPRA